MDFFLLQGLTVLKKDVKFCEWITAHKNLNYIYSYKDLKSSGFRQDNEEFIKKENKAVVV